MAHIAPLSTCPVEGALAGTASGWRLTMHRSLASAPSRAWADLTLPDRMRMWAPFVPDRTMDGRGELLLTHLEGRDDVGFATVERVLTVEPDRCVVYTWGPGVLSFHVAPNGAGSILRLRHEFPDKSVAANVAAGWHLCLAALTTLATGLNPPPVAGQAAMDQGWRGIHDAYDTLFRAASLN